jgi:hypothetical protein
MQPHVRVVPRRASAAPLALIVLAAAMLVAGPAPADETQPAPSSAGMRMYRDPATGEIGTPPAAGLTDTADGQPQLRAEAVEDPGAEAVELPGGGVKINLRGRYRSSVTRHLGPSGPTGHACSDDGAPTHE